jgi:hypothetical protein
MDNVHLYCKRTKGEILFLLNYSTEVESEEMDACYLQLHDLLFILLASFHFVLGQ